MKKKVLGIVIAVVAVTAAVVLGLFAAGVIGGKKGEPVAKAVSASATDSGFFGELGKDAYFDVRADRDPATAIDNYVLVRDSKGNKVAMKSARLDDGLYRLSARDGFRERASYQIWLYAAEFAEERYAPYSTFIFTIAGKEEVENVVVKSGIEKTEIEGAEVQEVTVGSDVFYNILLPSAAQERYSEGDVILAKKPETPILDGDLAAYYRGDIEGYEYNGLAAYTVLRESSVTDGREEIYCRLSHMNEVLDSADVYKHFEVNESNLKVNEEAIEEALAKSEFAASLIRAAEETVDFFDKDFVVRKEKPRMVVNVSADFADAEEEGQKVAILNFTFTITVAKGVDIVIRLNNTIHIDPKVNFDYDLTESDFTYECDLGVNVKTKTVCTIEMETPDTKIYCTTVDEFKEKFKQMISDQTTEKAICGAEMPIYNLYYPIYCFVFEVEFGVDVDFSLKAQIGFEYDYSTDITAGVTLVNGEFNSYKSFDSTQTAKDFVLLGKATIKGGVYVKFMGTLLDIAGVGLKVRFGAYAEVAGQIRIDMDAALKNSKLHVIKGYYVTGGLYLALGFSVKAGVDVPVYGFLGYKNSWDLAEMRYPLFEYGSKYLIKEFVNPESTVEIQGNSAMFDSVLVNAFDIDKVADANRISVPVDSFDVTYLGDAAEYVTLRDGAVYVNPAVGTEFNAQVKLSAKSDSYVTGVVTFHKAAVMPTAEETEATFDKKNASDLTFDVTLNKSEFVSLTGSDITPAFYSVASSGDVTIYKSFLSSLSMGEHKFNYNTNRGNIVLTVYVINSTPVTAEKTAATFNKSARANVTFKLDLFGNSIKSVSGLERSEYTVDKTGTFVIYALSLMEKPAGEYSFVVTATNGTSVSLTVNVKDDRAPVLYQSAYVFGKSAAVRADVPVKFEKYGYEVKSVEGNKITPADYKVQSGAVLIDASYLSKLDAGVYSFSLKFKTGSSELPKPFTISVKENASLVAYSQVATFDLDKPADVTFNVVSTGNLLVSGNGIGAASYSFAGNSLTIRASYLSTLAEGEYDYTVSRGSESTTVTVNVVNTAVPEIQSEDVSPDGSLSLTYDKAKAKEMSFEMFLPGPRAFSADDLKYSLKKTEKGTYKLTINASFLENLSVGEHEFELLTGVNSLYLTLNVINSAAPSALSETSLSYKAGSEASLSVQFENAKAKVKNVEVKGEGVTADTKTIGVESFCYVVDVETQIGTFTIDPSYTELLPSGYYRVFVTFGDASSSGNDVTIGIGIAVS